MLHKTKNVDATTWDRTKDLSVNSRPLCQRSSGGTSWDPTLVLEKDGKLAERNKTWVGRMDVEGFLYFLFFLS